MVTTTTGTVGLDGSQRWRLLRLDAFRAGRTAVPFARRAPQEATTRDGRQKAGWEEVRHRHLIPMRRDDAGQPQQFEGSRDHGRAHEDAGKTDRDVGHDDQEPT
jgi:hypothetical protein